MPHITDSASVAFRRCVQLAGAVVFVTGSAMTWHAAAAESAALMPLQDFSVETMPLPAIHSLTNTDPHAQSLRDSSASGLHARWSWGNRTVGLGASAEWATRATASASRSMWGVHADLAPRTRLIYEVRSGAPAADNGLLPDPAAQTRWTLEVKPAEHPLRQWQSGLLRLQMSSTSTLALRPRGGGMTVSWQSRF